jgi:hypothetical protein
LCPRQSKGNEIGLAAQQSQGQNQAEQRNQPALLPARLSACVLLRIYVFHELHSLVDIFPTHRAPAVGKQISPSGHDAYLRKRESGVKCRRHNSSKLRILSTFSTSTALTGIIHPCQKNKSAVYRDERQFSKCGQNVGVDARADCPWGTTLGDQPNRD